jgi:hypothetical protein
LVNERRQAEDIFDQLACDGSLAADLALRSQMIDTLIVENEKRFDASADP